MEQKEFWEQYARASIFAASPPGVKSETAMS